MLPDCNALGSVWVHQDISEERKKLLVNHGFDGEYCNDDVEGWNCTLWGRFRVLRNTTLCYFSSAVKSDLPSLMASKPYSSLGRL